MRFHSVRSMETTKTIAAGSRGGGGETWTSGIVLKSYMACQYSDDQGGSKKDMFNFLDLLDSPTQLLMINLSLIFIVTRITHQALRPLRQSMIIAHIVAGIVIGPSLLTSNHGIARTLFPPSARYILKTISAFGCMLHLFIFGVKIDVGTLRKIIGGKAIFVGLSGFFISLALGTCAFNFLKTFGGIDKSDNMGIIRLLILNSMSFFVTTSSYLSDIKITNTEVGVLACSSSAVIDAFAHCGLAFMQKLDYDGIPLPPTARWAWFLLLVIYYSLLFLILRPMIIFIVGLTPEGQAMKRSHFMAVLSIVLLAWFLGECLGQRLSTFLFGLSLPDGPPLGSILVQKLEVFTSNFLLPVYFTMSGVRANLQSLKGNTSAWSLELIVLSCRFGKFLGTLGAAVFANVPIHEGVPLALIMCCQGVMEVIVLSNWKDDMIVDSKLFNVGLVNVVIFAAVILPLIQQIYDPSIGYEAYYRRSVQGCNAAGDLQVIVCIHKEENVPTVINLLDTMKSSRGGSVSIIALQLVQLTGKAMPILAPLHQARASSLNLTRAHQIANAFQYFERHGEGYVKAQHFVSVTPYSSMHNDICLIAHDKRASLIVIPFHKQWAVDGMVGASSLPIRELNQRVLHKAPCSVAVLVDREPLGSNRSILKGARMYHVVMLFIGGADDHEALAIARRMSNHSNVGLTVIWLKSEASDANHSDIANDHHACIDPESEVIRDFQFGMKGNDRVTVDEMIVSDGIGTTKAVISAQHADLFIIGRHHEPNCPATLGIAMWSDYPELGMVGDMLTSTTEFQFSVLVVQQQPKFDFTHVGSRKVGKEDPFGLFYRGD
ncbi:hypothetical protein Droror1_Dr00015290 [Drosera rotundifolia]